MAGPDSPKYAVNPETGQVMRNDGTGWAKVKTAKNQQGEILINEGGTWTPLPGRAPAAPSGFAAPPKMSIAQAADVAGAQGKEFGFADEASALKRSVGIPKSADKLFEINPFNRFLNIGLGAGTAIADAAGVKMSPKYTQAKDAENAQLAQARTDRPVTSFVSEVVQSLPYPGGALRMGAPIVRETAKMLGLGSLQGAIYGFGSGEGEGRIESAGTGATVGGALGAATPGLAAAALPVVRGTRTALANATDAIVEMFGGTGTAGQAYARQVAEAAVRRSMERSGMTPERILETLQRFGNKPAVLAEVIGQDAVNTLSSLTRRPGSTPQAAQDIIAERMGGFPERAADDLRQTTGLTDAQIRGEFGPELATRREAAAPAYTELFEQQGGVTSDRLTQLAGTNTLGPLIRRSQAAAEDLAVSQRRDPASVTPLEVLDLAKRELDDEIATAQRNQQNAELFRLQSLQTALLGELDELTGGQYAAARDLGGEAPRLQEARTQGEQALRPGVTRATVNEQVGALNPQDRAAFASGTASVIDESIAGGRMLPQRFRLPANREKVEAAFGPEAGGEFANRMTAEAELRDLASRWGPRQGSITGTVMESGPSEALDDGIRFATSIARGDRIGFINQAVSWMRRRGYNQQQIDAMGELLLSNPQEGLRRLGIQLPRLPGGGGAAAAGAAAGTPPPPAGAPPPQAPAPRTVGVAPATAAPVGAPAPTTPTRTSGIVGSGDLTNAAFGAGLGGIAPAESPEERARNMAIGAGIGGFARRGSQMLDDATRTVGQPRATSGRTVGQGGYFGRQSMRPPGSGPSAREIETQQQWATATPIVTQARTTAQSAQQAADAALQSKAPADIARAKDQKKTLVGQLQEAQASRAGMDTPEDARLAETLASLTENTSDPVLLSTQISAAKTSLDRLLTDIGGPVEGNLIPVRTNILTRTQAPRSAAEGPQDRASVTRYAEGSDDVQPMGFGASVPPKPVQQAVNDEYFNLLKQGKRREALRLLHKERGVTLEDSRINRGGAHSPPSASDGAPGYDVASNGIYPDDLYSANGRRYYGTGDDSIDGPAFDVIRSMEANPNKMITIYRSVEKGAPGKINPGDWVTTVRKYAKDHGEANIGGDYKIIKKTVAARDIFTDGNSVAEWGYSPQPMLPSHRGAYTEDLKRIPGEWKPVYGTDDDLPPIKSMGFGASTPKTPEQAVRFETPGSPEYEAAVAKGLDMSQAGRIGRAEEMGFDTETAVYRGLTRPYDADTLVPGRFQFLAHDPNVASGYARNFADREGANVVKAFLRKPNPLMVDAGGANWDRIDTRNLPEELRAILDPRATIAAIATAARSRGYGHVTVRNVVDLADGGVGSPTTVEVVWDPSNIRSVNAAFDPEKSGSSTLLAAAPFAAVSGAGLTLAGEDARNQRTVGKPKTSQSARTVGKAKTN